MGRRCLIVGASGQLGRALSACLSPHGEVVEAVHRTPQPGQRHIDLEDAPCTVEVLTEIQPEWIVIAGAYCNVDGAETDRERCLRVNAEGPRAIAEYARRHGGRVVYYSSDYIFDGSRERDSESDPPQPLNVYAQSKVLGEAAIRELLPDRHLIIRTAWLYGPDEARKNFVLRLVGELTSGRQVLVPRDQWGTPTYTEDLARATRQLLEQERTGTFHATGPDFLDRSTLANKICQQFGLATSGLKGVSTAELHQAAKRPLRVRLACQKLQSLGIGGFRGIDAGLDALKRWYLTTVS